jgi:hypothetical protein
VTNVFIFVPAFGQQISAATFMTTHAIHQTLAAKAIAGSFSTLSFPDIAELRSMAMTIWYDAMPQSDYLLFIDADMAFPPDLILDMILLNEPIVGTIYPQRKMPISWAGSGDGGTHTERRANFMKVEGVGMGCTLIRRDVVATFLQKMPELVDTRIKLHPAKEMMEQAGTNRIIRAFEKLDIPERGLVSEDLSFCIRWGRMGGSIWAGIGYEMNHIGPFNYSGCYLRHVEEVQKKMALEEQQKLAEQRATSIAELAAAVPNLIAAE